MDLASVLENLKNTNLWRRWLLAWLGIGVLFGLTYATTSSLNDGLYAALSFHVIFVGIGVLFFHPRDSIVPFLSALSVSLLIWGLIPITGFSSGVTFLEFAKTCSQLFYYGLVLGIAMWTTFGVFFLGSEVLSLAQKAYLKIENKLVVPPKK